MSPHTTATINAGKIGHLTTIANTIGTKGVSNAKTPLTPLKSFFSSRISSLYSEALAEKAYFLPCFLSLSKI